MKARWLSAAALATLVTAAGFAGTGCEDPVNITPSDNAVGTTQTTGADISTGSANAVDPSTINNVHPSDSQDQQQGQQGASAQGTSGQSQQQAQPAQSYTPAPAQQPNQSQQPQQQAQQQAAPADTSGFGTLPMPNAETQVGSYSANTVINQGGTGSVVTDMSGAPAQGVNGSNANVNSANAPNAYSTSASNAITNASPAGAAAIIGAAGTANDLAPADPRSSQSVYNSSATQAPVNNQIRSGAYAATPVQPLPASRIR